MRWWPWTSVARLEDVRTLAAERLADAQSEIDWLRGRMHVLEERNRELTDQVTRIARRDRGMPEEPRQPREKPEEMPSQLSDYFDGIYPENIGTGLRNAALARRKKGETWESIVERYMPAEEDFDHTPDRADFDEEEEEQDAAGTA